MRQMVQQLERRWIRPVNILEHEKHRLICRESFQNSEDQLERTLAFTLGSGLSSCRIVWKLGKNRSEHCAQWTEHFSDRLAFSLCDPEAESIHQRSVRNG